MFKKILLTLIIANNVISNTHALSPKDLQIIGSDASNGHQLEQVITLAELNDMLIKIEDDLEELYNLDRPDIQEIAIVLEAKRTALIELLEKVTATIRNQENSENNWTRKILIGSSITLGVAALIGTGCLSSYDMSTKNWHRPTGEQFVKNIGNFFGAIGFVLQN